MTTAFAPTPAGYLGICSFNIKWLGHFKARDNNALAGVLRPCDAVVIQEMVAPPWDVTLADGAGTLKANDRSAAFVSAMKAVGFDGVWLSDEDTGPKRSRTNTPAAEWFILFFRTSQLTAAPDLPHGFIDQPLAQNAIFDRVPYAFALRAVAKGQGGHAIDFVIIDVHLHVTNNSKEPIANAKVRRLGEFSAIAAWIEAKRRESGEQNFFVAGDTNIEDAAEVAGIIGHPDQDMSDALAALRPDLLSADNQKILQQYTSLNLINAGGGNLTAYGTNLSHTKPFDQVFYSPESTGLTIDPSFLILDLAATFSQMLSPTDRTFSNVYSDHDPVKFHIGL